MNTQQLTPIQTAWDQLAEGYDAYVTPGHDQTLPRKALGLAGLRQGMKFLDVASGTGTLSLPAAQLGADVVAIDISPGMIRLLKQRFSAAGLQKVEARVMDGQALAIEENTFDVTGSQFGVMLFPDLPRGLLEMVRVTKKGGTVLIIAYGAPATIEFLILFLKAMKAVFPDFSGLPTDPPPLPFQLAAPKVLRQKMAEAGLQDITVEQDVERLKFYSGQDMWNWVINSNPIAAEMVLPLTADQKTEVQQVLDHMLRDQFQGRDYALLHARVNLGIGKKL